MMRIKVIEAKLTRDTELFSKMDPFCEIKYSGKKYRTKVKEEAGKKPKWNEEFQFKITDISSQFTITVFDEDMTTNDLVGDVVISAKKLLSPEE